MVRRGWWIAVLWLGWPGCGPTAAEIKTARDASYQASPREVYAVAEQETAASYPIGERLPDELVFATVPQWFTDNGRQSRAPEDEQKKAGNMQVSFAVLVSAEGAGAKILITGGAVDYVPGKREPLQLDESALPSWVSARIDKLRVRIHKRVQATLASPPAK
jgi:hypothetical protein